MFHKYLVFLVEKQVRIMFVVLPILDNLWQRNGTVIKNMQLQNWT